MNRLLTAAEALERAADALDRVPSELRMKERPTTLGTTPTNRQDTMRVEAQRLRKIADELPELGDSPLVIEATMIRREHGLRGHIDTSGKALPSSIFVGLDASLLARLGDHQAYRLTIAPIIEPESPQDDRGQPTDASSSTGDQAKDKLITLKGEQMERLLTMANVRVMRCDLCRQICLATKRSWCCGDSVREVGDE